MGQYITLLRGINVSGQKKIKMADLKVLMETNGLNNVITYIQSGNLIFNTTIKDIPSINSLIHNAILEHYGFEVTVLTLTRAVLNAIFLNNPYLSRIEDGEIEEKKMFFTLLSSIPDPELIKELNSVLYTPEEFDIAPNVVYFFAANGYGKTKLHNNFFERKLKCKASTRNLRTLQKLLELSAR